MKDLVKAYGLKLATTSKQLKFYLKFNYQPVCQSCIGYNTGRAYDLNWWKSF
jgi:hypothetical protein